MLVDVLGALNRGGAAVADLERAMTAILKAFRPGANSWLALVLGRKIDRVLFAATKADHLPSIQPRAPRCHSEADRRRGDRAGRNRRRRGFSAGALGIAGNARDDGDARTARRFPVSAARPIKGERIGKVTFDGATEAAIFPGDLPADPAAALSAARSAEAASLELVRFAPPRLSNTISDGRPAAFPHIRLDRALDFLVSDYLA